jgi:hypothetical protein
LLPDEGFLGDLAFREEAFDFRKGDRAELLTVLGVKPIHIRWLYLFYGKAVERKSTALMIE